METTYGEEEEDVDAVYSDDESEDERNAYALQVERFKSGFPKIPAEMFAALPNEVKEIMKLQHEYYLARYKQPIPAFKPREKLLLQSRKVQKIEGNYIILLWRILLSILKRNLLH